MSEVIVRDFMQDNPLTVGLNTTLVKAVEILISKKLSGLAVINDNNEVVGFISEYDCHKAMLMSSYHCDNPVYVCDIMKSDFINVSPEDGIADVAIKLLEETTSLYLVVKDKKLIGTLTRQDILYTLNENLSLCSKISKNI
jgi:predicted transcriptional regulator